MAIEIKLPELGDGIESGDVLDVLVHEGDTIEKDQTICELETDKAMVEIPSTQTGKIVKVHIASGQSIPIGATLLTVEAVADPAPTPAAPAAPQLASESPAPTSDETPTPAPVAPASDIQPPVPPPASDPVAPPAAQTDTASDDMAADSSSAAAGPAIRRLAREVGIDLTTITGSGPSGRITRDDVLAAVRRSSSAGSSDVPPAQEASSVGHAEVQADEDANPPEPQAATPPNADEWGPIRVERLAKIRRTIAKKMYESWSTAPRVTNFDDADVTELEQIRQASKRDYASRGIKLTSMPFVIKAVALALKQNPVLNASLDEDEEQIIYKQYVNVGIAVDTERGLVVPALRGPDEASIPDIARSLGSIAENARNNNFAIRDLRGSTFTISNLGAVGGTYSTPIINVPEVAILLLGRSRKMPVVVDEQVTVRYMMPLSLSYDHRLVDGAAAARFLNDVIGLLETPSRLLIAP